MLDVHFYGRFRKYAPDSSATSISKIQVEYVEGENVEGLVKRLGIDPADTGTLFVNHRWATLKTIIPHDESRVAIFPREYDLIDGGLYLRFESASLKTEIEKEQEQLEIIPVKEKAKIIKQTQ